MKKFIGACVIVCIVLNLFFTATIFGQDEKYKLTEINCSFCTWKNADFEEMLMTTNLNSAKSYVEYGNNGRYVQCKYNGFLSLYDVESDEVVYSLKTKIEDEDVYLIPFSFNNKIYCCLYTNDNTCLIFDNTGAKIKELYGGYYLGGYLFCCSTNYDYYIYNLKEDMSYEISGQLVYGDTSGFVKKDGYYYRVNEDGKTTSTKANIPYGSIICGDVGNDIFAYGDNGYNWDFGHAVPNGGLIDSNGNIIFSGGSGLFRVAEYHEGLLGVCVDSKWGFIDTTGKLKIPCKYENVNYFSEGLAATMDKSEKIGYINKTGETVFPFMYSWATAFEGGVATVTDSADETSYLYYPDKDSISKEITVTYDMTNEYPYDIYTKEIFYHKTGEILNFENTGITVYSTKSKNYAEKDGKWYKFIPVYSSTKKDFTNITFADKTFLYDGTEKSIVISGNLPQGAKVTYTNNKATLAGTYNATAKITCDGYNDLTLTATLKITKTVPYNAQADINHDNALNAKDITLLRRYIVGGYDVEL